MPEIHELPSGSVLTGAEYFPVSQELIASKITLDDIAAFVNYQDTTVTFTSLTLAEIGSTRSNFTLNWSIGPTARTLVSQTFNGDAIDVADRSKLITDSITGNTTWTVVANDGKSSGTGSVTQSFGYTRFYGAASSASLSDTQIKALTADLSTQSRVQSRQITCSNQYIYFCWPDSWGGNTASSFTVNGLLNTAWTLVRNDTFTNASGASYTIRLYRSNNLLTGTFNVSVS